MANSSVAINLNRIPTREDVRRRTERVVFAMHPHKVPLSAYNGHWDKYLRIGRVLKFAVPPIFNLPVHLSDVEVAVRSANVSQAKHLSQHSEREVSFANA